MLYALLLLLFIYNSVVFITTALEHDGKAQHGGGVVGGRYEIIWNRWNMVKQWNLYISRCKEWSGICSMQAGWSGLPAWLHPLTLSTTATYFITLLVPSTHGTCFQSVSICFDMFCMFYLSSLFLSSHSCKDFWSNLQSDHRENCKQIWFGLHFSLIRSSVVLVLGLLLLATCFFSLCQNLHRQSSRDEDHLEHRSITITCLASLFFPAHCSLPSTLVGILLVAGRCAFSSPDSIFF